MNSTEKVNSLEYFRHQRRRIIYVISIKRNITIYFWRNGPVSIFTFVKRVIRGLISVVICSAMYHFLIAGLALLETFCKQRIHLKQNSERN